MQLLYLLCQLRYTQGKQTFADVKSRLVSQKQTVYLIPSSAQG